MTPGPKHLAMAHLWLYSAGVDPESLDSNGDSLADSLGALLAGAHKDGRREAAAQFLKARPVTRSGEYSRVDPAEDTGRYSSEELDELLDRMGT